jgi:hypothetical protein
MALLTPPLTAKDSAAGDSADRDAGDAPAVAEETTIAVTVSAAQIEVQTEARTEAIAGVEVRAKWERNRREGIRIDLCYYLLSLHTLPPHTGDLA